jgi:hypothetical protein
MVAMTTLTADEIIVPPCGGARRLPPVRGTDSNVPVEALRRRARMGFADSQEPPPWAIVLAGGEATSLLDPLRPR